MSRRYLRSLAAWFVHAYAPLGSRGRGLDGPGAYRAAARPPLATPSVQSSWRPKGRIEAPAAPQTRTPARVGDKPRRSKPGRLRGVAGLGRFSRSSWRGAGRPVSDGR